MLLGAHDHLQLFFTRRACAFASSFVFQSILMGYSFGGQDGIF
jgi:hypothetical protein